MKKGFTLIELLAVIVILAIIALIATPIILGIINETREESNERSVELYASAAKNAIAKYQLNNTGAPTSFDQLEIEYDGDVECTTEELYSDGSIYLAGCTVNGDAVEYTYGTKQGSSIEVGKLSSVCNPISVATEGSYTAGDKYECKVDPNKGAYTFYVLTSVTDPEATNVNLIMDSNIRIGGEAVKEVTPTTEQKGTVAWITQSDYEREDIGGTAWDDWTDRNAFGPITAIEYLASATANWTNLNTMTISTFTDDEGATHNIGKTYTAYARLPYYSEISNVSSSKLYLIEYLDGSEDAYHGIIGRNGVNGLYGYWTLSSYTSGAYIAWTVYYYGIADTHNNVDTDGDYGVRPVITLSI